MGLLFYLIIASAALVVALSVFLIRARMRNRELERLLDHTNSRLERLQLHFGRFTPQEVIEHLTELDERYAARIRSVTVLFADLKGFTKMCDNRDPAEVVSILNGYFRCMSEALANHHGQVTELMGDGILTLFGALGSNPWQVQDAVMGALAMRKALVEYNEELRSKSLPELSFGIGIHQGEVLVGVMGNFELSKFGVVGDTINVASRVEALTRVHDVDLLVTEEVRNQLDDRFSLKEMPAVPIKGKQEPIVTYLVEGLISENLG
jgi:class 3 adenylate cyclase